MFYPALSRRQLLQLATCSAIASKGSVWAQRSGPTPSWLLLGTNQGEGILRASWNVGTGEIGQPELAAATPHPTFLALHPRLPVVYACSETNAPDAAIFAYSVDRSTARLTQLATQPTLGDAPCFVSVDSTGHLLFAANYGGSLSVFPLSAQGSASPATQVFQCAGNTACGAGGPVKDRQSGPHLHCATLSPDNRHVLACDLGDDAILVFALRAAPHPLEPPLRIATRPGAGPRHLAFHPNGQWLYCINELDCTVALYSWHAGPSGDARVQAVPQALVSVGPPRAGTAAATSNSAPSTGAEISVTRDGRFLYTSTRSADVLTVFSIHRSTGFLMRVQQIPCGGKTPRFYALDATERWLVCANQDSDTLSVFARDPETGQLSAKRSVPAPNPECLLWL